MASRDQKLHILYIRDMLLERTNENHLLNAAQIREILAQEHGISVDRRTIYSEIEILKKYGLDIEQKKGTNPGYYVGARDFELPELKLLVDAVQSSKFITELKSRELIRKLEKLCCRADAAVLQKQVFIVNRPKTENETIFYNVENIHNAICSNREITFQYCEWNLNRELVPKKAGAMYVVSPWALTWDDENYYLVGYDAAAGKIKHYRVDKMQRTFVLESDRKGQQDFEGFDLPAFTKKTFGMYGGYDTEVSLTCRNGLVGVMLDRFGHDIWIIPVDADYFRIRVMVSVSPQFFGWLTGLGPGAVLDGPKNVREEYAAFLQEVMGNYLSGRNRVLDF